MRLATQHDVSDIMAALRKLKAKSPAYQMQFADEAAAECGVRIAIYEGRGWLVAGFFIMVDVGPEWWSNKTFLIEKIILRIEKTDTPVQVAVDALDTLATHYGCDAVIVGDTQVGYMHGQYIAAGYAPLGTQLMKECPTRT